MDPIQEDGEQMNVAAAAASAAVFVLRASNQRTLKGMKDAKLI